MFVCSVVDPMGKKLNVTVDQLRLTTTSFINPHSIMCSNQILR